MRLPRSEHTSRPWRIHQIAPEFAVEDVWALPTTGGPGQLSDLVTAVFGGRFPNSTPPLVRFLWEARWKLGAVFRWDDEADGLGQRVPLVRDRLTDQQRAESVDPGVDLGRFSLVYQFEDEFAAELANRTVHAVMHLGWVPDGRGGYRGQLAVLVKPNGPLGSLYLAGIAPLRHHIVYPALLRHIGRQWRAESPVPHG